MRNLLLVLSLCLASGLQLATAQVEYTVLPGDTFARIARAHDVTLTELREANPGRGEALSPGDVVRIPQPMQLVRVLDASQAGAEVHTVEAGQTLYAIANLYGLEVEQLEAWNPTAAQGLSIGDVLVVGAAPESAEPASLGAPVDASQSLPSLRQDTLRALLMLPFMLANWLTPTIWHVKLPKDNLLFAHPQITLNNLVSLKTSKPYLIITA